MVYLTLTAAVIVICYTVAMCLKKKAIPESLSQTVFLLGRKSQWMFGAVMIVCGVLFGIVMIDKSSENTQFLAFLTLAASAVLVLHPCLIRTLTRRIMRVPS